LKIGQENNLYYIHHLETSQLELMRHGMMHIVNCKMTFLISNLFVITKCHIQIYRKKEGSIDFKRLINSWNDNIDNEINDFDHVISITKKINIEQYIF
jgi:hypothetical protein